MADAVFWQVLESVQTDIRALEFSTQSGDTAPPPKDDAVVIRKVPFRADDETHDRSEDTPGILIAPLRALSPPTAGTNKRDDVTYVVTVQVFDRDSTFRDENLKTYLKWQEQIRKVFQNSADSSIQGSEGIVNLRTATDQDPVEATLFKSVQYFVCSQELRFTARETRGVTT